MNISRTLIFENRSQYLKVIIFKTILAFVIAKLYTYQGTFLGTFFLDYFAFNMFYFSLRVSKNYLIAVILILGICIGIIGVNEYLHNKYSVETSNLFFMFFALFPFT